MKYLLDTNICIYLMHRQPPALASRFRALTVGDVGISVITYAELRVGIEKLTDTRQHNERVLELFLKRVPFLPFDEGAALAYGTLRAAVPDRRRNALDRLIAAHAVSLGAVLVTDNEADFTGYPGLAVENWTRGS
ncbi:putative VagD protein [Methylococcus capsulatus str. Bath]|uniref:Ribonuclease VapC n=1 Tax=Methylococcus capsulatus (strain ATCC 33009 / NCIMB 11132 / Bath) TaxID=243233 RepID=Q607X9_METCA|nr:type II toxin-antitoxin system VapC family toxin [Methylococcus capsulatus]AAU92375.1 putative VagD protein [Methylococcus capsulatus str. Bath]